MDKNISISFVLKAYNVVYLESITLLARDPKLESITLLARDVDKNISISFVLKAYNAVYLESITLLAREIHESEYAI